MRRAKGRFAAAAAAAENSGKTVVRGRVENLRPWPKGTSGNPGGRPKSAALSGAFRAVLGEVVSTPVGDFTVAELIARRLARDAVRRGSVGAARELGNRAEGYPGSTLEVRGQLHSVVVLGAGGAVSSMQFEVGASRQETEKGVAEVVAAELDNRERRERAAEVIRSGGGQDGTKKKAV